MRNTSISQVILCEIQNGCYTVGVSLSGLCGCFKENTIYCLNSTPLLISLTLIHNVGKCVGDQCMCMCSCVGVLSCM